MSGALRRLAALYGHGKFAELEHEALEVLRRDPQSGVVWQLLAAALTAQGKDARLALSRAVQCNPQDASAHNNLGNASARAGQFADAIASYRRALALLPQLVEAHENMARALLSLGRLDEAAASCRQAIVLRPNYAPAHGDLGTIQMAMGLVDDAVTSWRRAVDIDPGFFEAHGNLGNALRRRGQIDQALASYDRALQIAPRFAEAHCNRAMALRLLGQPEQARAACHRALAINPRLAAALIVAAELSADSGDFLEAERSFKQAIEIEPEAPEAWAGLAAVRTMTAEDAGWLQRAQAIAERPLAPHKQAVLDFAIGKGLDDMQQFSAAFTHFRRANETVKRCRAPHDRVGLAQTVDSIMHRHDKKWIGEARHNSSDSAVPVFIVGMLRSGTSLAEQILASHPAIVGGGELSYWSNAVSLQPDIEGGRLTRDYLQLLRAHSVDALRIVDKMPTNFAHLGLIHALLPNARIIHMQRDPLDTCLSIYFQNFDTAVTYANDLDDLAHYYEQYLRLMSHWRASLPAGVMLEVPYEDLVIDPEFWSRKMIEFLGLPWTPQCLEFHRTKRAVLTASKWQVRQRISNAAVGRWRNYEKQLGSLRRLASDALAVRSNCE
jgi:tetratricopeptide (TPR) repeat protein